MGREQLIIAGTFFAVILLYLIAGTIKHKIRFYCEQWIGDRERQEDSAYVKSIKKNGSEYLLALVADGMGGHFNGQEASMRAAGVFQKGFMDVTQYAREINGTEFLREKLLLANKEVNKIGGNKDGNIPGTTLSAIFIKDTKAYFVSIGDSRIYILRNGGVELLTTDHNREYEIGQKRENGESVTGNYENNESLKKLISFLGRDEITIYDISLLPLGLKKGDRIVVCSDGIYDNIPVGKIEEINSAATPKRLCKKIMEYVKHSGNDELDNATIIAIEI